MALPVNVKFDMRQLEMLLSHYEGKARSIPMSIVGETVAAAIDDLIESEGDGSWKRFSPVTLKLHPNRRGGKLLQATGRLANMQIRSGTNWVDVESPAPYAIYHHMGTDQVRGWVESDEGMPQRDFLDIDMVSTLEEAAGLILADIVQG
jgi:phage gpG-like protein